MVNDPALAGTSRLYKLLSGSRLDGSTGAGCIYTPNSFSSLSDELLQADPDPIVVSEGENFDIWVNRRHRLCEQHGVLVSHHGDFGRQLKIRRWCEL